MKKVIYTFLSIVTVSILMSHSSGYGESEGEGVTGAPTDAKLPNGDAKTCQYCHNNGSFNPAATIEILDDAGTTAVTKYEAGKTYTIRMTINAGSGTPNGYGFQMIDIRKSNNTNAKGFASTQAAGIKLTTLTNGNIYVEHSIKSTSKTFNIKWKAPSPSIGTVTFYAVGNAVNGNGAIGGDNGTASIKIDFADLTSNINELVSQVQMTVSPNPSSEMLNLFLKSALSKTVHIQLVDINGQNVLNEKWQIQIGDNIKIFDINHLSKGVYMIQVIENQNIISKKIIKI